MEFKTQLNTNTKVSYQHSGDNVRKITLWFPVPSSLFLCPIDSELTVTVTRNMAKN